MSLCPYPASQRLLVSPAAWERQGAVNSFHQGTQAGAGASPAPPCKFSGASPQPRAALELIVPLLGVFSALIVPLLGIFSAHFQLHPQHSSLRMESYSGLALSVALGLQARKPQQVRDLGIRAPRTMANPWKSQQIPSPLLEILPAPHQVLREIPQSQAGR